MINTIPTLIEKLKVREPLNQHKNVSIAFRFLNRYQTFVEKYNQFHNSLKREINFINLYSKYELNKDLDIEDIISILQFKDYTMGFISGVHTERYKDETDKFLIRLNYPEFLTIERVLFKDMERPDEIDLDEENKKYQVRFDNLTLTVPNKDGELLTFEEYNMTGLFFCDTILTNEDYETLITLLEEPIHYLDTLTLNLDNILKESVEYYFDNLPQRLELIKWKME